MTAKASVGFIHPGEYKACFGKSLRDLLLYDLFHHRRIMSHDRGEIGLEVGAGELVVGRNAVAQAFLDSEADWLFMVDSDMGFAETTVDDLIDAADPKDRPVVGGLAFACKSDGSGPFHARRYRPTPTLYRMAEADGDHGFIPWFDYPRGELVEVDATGAACLLVHRSAFERIAEAHGPTWFNRIPKPNAPVGSAPFGEDMSFCLRVKACDMPLYVHTGVQTTHDKGGVFFDEGTYDRDRAARKVS